MQYYAPKKYCGSAHASKQIVLILMKMHLFVMLVGSTNPMQHSGRFHDSLDIPAPNLGHDGVDEFQKVVSVSNADTNHIHGDTVTNQKTEAKHDPG
jgi:hypothetical protein